MSEALAISTAVEAAAKWGEPGVFPGVSFEKYAALGAVNKTLLSHLAVTPADAKVFIEGGGEINETLEFGIGTHCLILEPEKFNLEYAIGPDVKLNTREGKQAWAEFVLNNPGKRVLRGEAGATMLAMRERLFEHPMASELLRAEGTNEVSVVWRDPITGMMCKSRLDRLIHWKGRLAIVDYKTAASASKRDFPRAYAQHRYFLQEALYRDGTAAAVGEVPAHFFFVAQEKHPPYKVNVFEFPAAEVEKGRKLYRELLELFVHCGTEDDWRAIGPEYSDEIVIGEVPEFAMRNAG